MTLRPATIDDRVAIARLHADSWRATYRGAYRDEYLDGDVVADRLRVWESRLSTPAANQLVLVAEDEGTIVGFACAYGGDDARWGTLLDNLHVRPGTHGRGTGRRLLSDVALWCRDRHPDRGLYLWVLSQNARARRFYERMGATDCGGDVSVPPGGGQIDSRRYAWTTVWDAAFDGSSRRSAALGRAR
jgi:GNAT superfamily N-acetyltransferase